MKIIFLSDVHYKGLDDPNTPLLLKFLESELKASDVLVIVGDLFDLWVGYDHIVYAEYVPVLAKFYELKKKGVRIVYVEGNHDVFLGPFFTEKLGVEVLNREGLVVIDNKKFYLHHGDGIDKRGLFKKIALGFLRSKGAIVLSRLIGPNLLWKVGQKLSHSSRQYGSVVSGARDRYRDFGKKTLIEKNCDYFIVGHTHIPDEYEVAKGKWYYNVGDWVRNYTYLEYLDGTFAIKKVR
ncbi:MAG TPA: UDP-2,3-diacylglucosamine diphosphatase [Bdellovibrionota bacterium]|nr:UDP-2,3-diacylglucosamine diphosphatase [Bdellovibrionota bacterium]